MNDRERGVSNGLRPWSSWTANSDKKYIELNGAALNVNKPGVTSRKTAFPKIEVQNFNQNFLGKLT